MSSFDFSKPRFSAVTDGFFEGVKRSYGQKVIDVVKSFSVEFGQDGVGLVWSTLSCPN